jgi:SAM-dependent methyltransferase
MPRDWVAWHADYDADTPLARRLAIVQEHVGRALDEREGAQVRVLSLCSGDGRDLIVPLAARGPAADVRGLLVELDPTLAARAREGVSAAGLHGLAVRESDAGTTASFADAVPADLVLLCGIFGNISDADIERSVRLAPALCAPGATLLWTRHRRPPDLTPRIREWFEDSGFRHEAFIPVPNGPSSVGVERLIGSPLPFEAGVRLFDFQES